MDPIHQALEAGLAAKTEARTFLQDAREKAAAEANRLPVLFPQLPRRIGREALGNGVVDLPSGGRVDLAAWRLCDAAAYVLLGPGDGAPASVLLDLFHHGDLEEKTMVLRALGALPGGAASDATSALFGEAQRTNNVAHFETLVLDSDLVARARTSGALDQEDVERLILKLAFLDLPLGRLFGWQGLVDQELTRMVQDLATEREAATRKVWHDTNRLIGHAPIAGTVARLLGGLEHGDDPHRAAAAEGLAALPDRAAYSRFAAERLEREPRAEIRARLEALARS